MKPEVAVVLCGDKQVEVISRTNHLLHFLVKNSHLIARMVLLAPPPTWISKEVCMDRQTLYTDHGEDVDVISSCLDMHHPPVVSNRKQNDKYS